MAAKSKSQTTEDETAITDPMVITVSELEKLNDEQKQEFRQKGGTVTPDPI